MSIPTNDPTQKAYTAGVVSPAGAATNWADVLDKLNVDAGFSLSRECLLITLKAGAFTGAILAPKLARKVAAEHKGQTHAFRTSLVAIDTATRLPMQSVISRARLWVAEHSSDWGGGRRIIKASRLPEFHAKIAEFQAALQSAKDEFLKNYPQVVAAAKKRLGEAFDLVEFPTKEWLDSRYYINFHAEPITDLNDVRVTGLTQAQVADIRKEMAAAYAAGIAGAQRALMDKLLLLANRVATVEFRETVVSDAEDLLAQVEKLNIVADPAITEHAAKLREVFRGARAELLKQDTPQSIALRNAMKQKAQVVAGDVRRDMFARFVGATVPSTTDAAKALEQESTGKK
jgi:hypothetical protein